MIWIASESFVDFASTGAVGKMSKYTYNNWCHRGKLIKSKACKNKKAQVEYQSIPNQYKPMVWQYLLDNEIEDLYILNDVSSEWIQSNFENYHQFKQSWEMNKPKDINQLSDREMQIAQARYSAIRAWQAYAIGAARGEATAKKAEWVERYNAQMIEHDLYQILGELSLKTIYRWEKTLKSQGNGSQIEVLAPSYRLSAINREMSPLEPAHQKLLKRLWLVPSNPTIASVYRLYEKEMKLRNEEIYSPFKVRRFLQNWAKINNAEYVYLTKGEKELKDKLMPFIERDNELLNFMDVIVADGHNLNFQIINPKTGKLNRATVIMWVDMYSLAILGFEIMMSENTQSVLSSLRSAMINAGAMLGLNQAIVPQITYTDNGKAFKNKYFKGAVSLEQKFSGLIERLEPYGLKKAVYAIPYNAQAKVNERVFGTFLEFEKQILTYSGNNILNKPARMKRNERFHLQEYQKALAQTGYLDLQSTYSLIGDWVNEYNKRPSHGKYLKGRSPWEAALEKSNLCIERTIAIENLNYLMLDTREVMLQRDGIRFMGRKYNSYQLSSLERGDWGLKIKYSMFDLSKILVYNDIGQFLCEAHQWSGQGVHPMAEHLGSGEDFSKFQIAMKDKQDYLHGTMDNAKSILKSLHEEELLIEIQDKENTKLTLNTGNLLMIDPKSEKSSKSDIDLLNISIQPKKNEEEEIDFFE
jgi:putative transposase